MFCYAYHFIHKRCVFCSWQLQCLSLTEVVMLEGAWRGTGKEEETSSGFQGIQSSMFIKLWKRYMTTYSYAIQSIFGAKQSS